MARKQAPTCKNCDKIVSGSAFKCPQCGEIQSNPTVIVATLLVTGLAGVFLYVFYSAFL